MNPISEISDEEFVPFLQSLGAETYKKSFEWILNDPVFADVLRWMSNNLDQNNALSAREEYRYIEIVKNGELLPFSELDASVAPILDEYPGMVLPGDQEGFEDVKLDITMQKERLSLLNKHYEVVEDLVKQDEQTRELLNLEVTKLHAAEQQGSEDVFFAAKECLQLAEEVESITEGIVEVIADWLEANTNCHADQDQLNKFVTFGPLESYRQQLALFRSHFDLFKSKRFNSKNKNNVTNEDLQSALIEAKNMEERLSDAALAYIESKAELIGEQAKLALVSNFNNVHPSQVTALTLESQSALELLEQEETIAENQLQDAVRSLVEFRTRLAVDKTTNAAVAVREQINTDLSHLLDMMQQALTLDRLLYCMLRQELQGLQDVLLFASQLRQYVIDEEEAVSSRIESMNTICSEHEACELKMETSDLLTQAISSILGVSTTDAMTLAKVYMDLIGSVRELRDNVEEAFKKMENGVVEFEKSTKPLRDFIWDGCTKQPNCRDRKSAAMFHSLRQEMEAVEKKVLECSRQFTSVKTIQLQSAEQDCLRKLWQWFLTDPNKLVAGMKVFSRKYS